MSRYQEIDYITDTWAKGRLDRIEIILTLLYKSLLK